ncbi:MAG: hypothetical protein ABI665_11240 [Vicinamibacterales bacterium]
MAPNQSESALLKVGESPNRSVELQPTGLRINELWVARPDVVAYLETIAPDKRGIALVHAIEVGIIEMVRRRRVPN